jgi:hypothetical protein
MGARRRERLEKGSIEPIVYAKGAGCNKPERRFS